MRGSTAGLADCMLRTSPQNAYNNFISLLDILISSFIVAPLAVGYWRGTWNLSVLLIYPHDPVRAGVTCAIVGLTGQILFNYYQETFKRILDPDKHRLTYYILSRIYTYVFGLCCVLTWSGIWTLVAEYITLQPTPMAICTCISLTCLCLVRGLRNIFGVPFYIAVDNPNEYFTVRTMYQRVVRRQEKCAGIPTNLVPTTCVERWVQTNKHSHTPKLGIIKTMMNWDDPMSLADIQFWLSETEAGRQGERVKEGQRQITCSH